MPNLTEEFIRICSDYEQSHKIIPQYTTLEPVLKDTFITECLDLYVNLTKFKEGVLDIKPEYLLTYTSNGQATLTDQQRDDFDLNTRMELRKFGQRLKAFEDYEVLRQAKKKSPFRAQRMELTAINDHRNGILRSLALEFKEVSDILKEMQKIRGDRTKDLRNTSHVDLNVDFRAPKYQLIDEQEDEAVKAIEQTLTAEQLQVLKTENSALLNAKQEELAKVNKIGETVEEIASLEVQLAEHLQVQSQGIRMMMDDHDTTHLDIVEGNKQLKKASGKGNWTMQAISFLAVICGLTLLILNRLKP